MRGDQLAVVVADQNRPRVLFDQPADHLRIFGRVKGVVTHESSFWHRGVPVRALRLTQIRSVSSTRGRLIFPKEARFR